MQTIDLRDLKDGPLHTRLELSAEDPALTGLAATLLGPVVLDGRLQATAGEDYIWRVQINARMATECRRCLSPVVEEIVDQFEVIFSADPELLDDPSVYQLPPHPITIDLGEAVREELALRIPAFSLCREECRGICARCGADLNTDACSCDVGPTN